MKIPSIPSIYRHMNRWREILSVLSKYGLADWISQLDVEFAKDLLKAHDGEVLARNTREKRIRLAFEELGPTFIKLGQILSTRPDVVGLELAAELRHLQADVPSDPIESVRTTIESELGRPVDDIFARFDETPVASASIGQAHNARLPNGEEVLVKVQHANIESKIFVDIEILTGLAQLAEKLPDLAQYRPVDILHEFRRMIRRELDFEREARNIHHFSRLFAGNPVVKIPRPYLPLTTARVIVMERIDGVKLTQQELLDQGCYDREELARTGAQMYMQMIFDDGMYHADPHPGNILVLPNNVIGLLDFGMVGRLDDQMQEEVQDMLMAIVDRDARYLTTTIIRIGSTPNDLDESALYVEVADFVEHYASQPLESFDLSGALEEMIEIIRKYHIILPPQLSMLLKVLIMLEGTAKLLSPRFSLMEVMQPYRGKLLRRQLSPKRQLKKLRRLFRDAEQLAAVLPRRLIEILDQVQSGKFDVHLDHRGLEPSVNRLVLGMLASSLIVGSAILLAQRIGTFKGIPIPGTLGMMLAFLVTLRLLRAIYKSGQFDRKG